MIFPGIPFGALSVKGPISFVASANTFSSLSASVAVNVPTGTQNGDLMIAIMSHYSDEGQNYTNGSWIEHLDVLADPGLYVAYRYASNEPASYTWSAIDSQNYTAAAILTYRNAIVDVFGNQSTITTTTTVTAPSITTTSDGVTLAVYGSEQIAPSTYGTPSTFASVLAVGTANTRFAVFSKNTSAGATGTVTSTTATSTADKVGVLLSIK